MSADSRRWAAMLGLAVALFAVMVLPPALFGGTPALAGLAVAALTAVAVLARRRAAEPRWERLGAHPVVAV